MAEATSLAVSLGSPLEGTQSTNERILRAISALYAGVSGQGGDPFSPRTAKTPTSLQVSPAARRPVREQGLKQLCVQLGVPCDPPRRKLTVLLVGTHSAGKSSFINHYVGERIQKTGVAVETQGFSFVTAGRRRETLSGPATLRLFEQLAPFSRLGATHAVTTEVSACRRRKAFPLVTLIDTPGLLDSRAFDYSFNIEECIDELARQADLVLVFFDPSMQAPDAILNMVNRLCEHARPKLRCFLSKADTVCSAADRNKVLVQLTSTLATRTGLNLRELPCLYLPRLELAHEAKGEPGAAAGSEAASGPPGHRWQGEGPAQASPSPRTRPPSASPPPTPSGPARAELDFESLPPNYIDELCADFETRLEHTVQGALERSRDTIAALEKAALKGLAGVEAARRANRKRARRSLALLAASAVPPLLLCCFTLAQAGWFDTARTHQPSRCELSALIPFPPVRRSYARHPSIHSPRLLRGYCPHAIAPLHV